MDTTRLFLLFSACCPGLTPFVTGYVSALVKAHNLKLRVSFLQQCLNEQVMPKSILPQRILRMSDRPFDDFQRIILQKHIDITRIQKQETFRITEQRKRAFLRTIPSEWRHQMLDYCYNKLRSARRDLQSKLRRKLKTLIDNSKWTQDSDPGLVVNLSTKELDKDTRCALGYGLNFSFSGKTEDSVEVAKSFYYLEKNNNLTDDVKNICKGIVYASMSLSSFPNGPKRFTDAIKKLKRDNEIHITTADKSKALVILNKEDYQTKMLDLLSDETTYYKVNTNPLNSVNSHFNKKLKILLKNNDCLVKQLISLSPSLPYMYGLIKTHKPNNPVRPIISSVGAASYKLSKWLVSILSPLIGTISNSNIKNSVDLVGKLKNLNINHDFKLVSFDVQSLFTKVPVDDLLNFLSDTLDSTPLPFPKDVIIELIKLCIKDCKFEFNGKYYAQQFGMAMGNPLSPVLSNLYMEFFEKHLLSNILPSRAIWYRYVDDILCLWPCNEDLNAFLSFLNGLAPTIKFTLEIEDKCQLPFLDCLIHRVDKRFKFSIYRKPTNVCSYIHYYSAHHNNVKESVFSSMFLRALRLCSPEYLDDEFHKIYNIACKLKYPSQMIDRSLHKAKKTFYRTEIATPRENKDVIVLPFCGRFSQIPRHLKPWNINVAFSNSCNVKKMLVKNSPNNSNGCVYKIPCKDCNSFYLGQTGKDLETRLKQHKYSVRTGQESNALFIHSRDNNHCIDWSNASSVVSCNLFVNRNIIESALIKHTEDVNMNMSSGLYKLDRFIVEKICKQVKI